MRVFVEPGGSTAQYVKMMERLGAVIVYSPHAADVIQLVGGPDVDPSMYGQGKHIKTNTNKSRDKATQEIVNIAVSASKPILGVCRGAQFLTAYSGGSLIQHVDGHAGSTHNVLDIATGRYWKVNSLHHQMMLPGPEAIVVATAQNVCTTREIVSEDNTVVSVPTDYRVPEVEATFIPGIRALCYQPHPEYVESGHDCRDYYVELLRRYFPSHFRG